MEARRRSSIEFVTAHEVAHQWWHGVVGSDSRRHPFQDECLAQYSAMLYIAERYGAERARREADQQVAAGYHMMRLMGREDAPVDRPASAFGDMLTYGGVVYGKGPFMYPALREELGDRAFFAALRGYVHENRFGTAPPRSLFHRMARGRHAQAVRAIVQRWLDEAHGDDDLGQPDLAGMLGQSGGGNGEATQMLRQLLGGGGQGGEGGDTGELMRGLMQMLQEGGGL
jgi:aminopeptidase N